MHGGVARSSYPHGVPLMYRPSKKAGGLLHGDLGSTGTVLLRSASAGVVRVGVLQLELVGMPIQHNVGVEELTLVANRLADISNLSTRHQQGVIRNPSIQIRIRDGLDQLMGEHGVRCIGQCTIGIGPSSGASPYVLVRFHTEYNVTDIREIDKAVVGAEAPCRGMVRRIADLVSRKARVDARRQEYVIFVAVAGTDFRGGLMDES